MACGQRANLTGFGAVSGGFWGTLVGLIFLNPLLGMAVGATAGAVSGALPDVGIDDRFMKELAEIKGTGGKMLRTSLTHEDEAKLQAALNAAKQ